MTTIQPLLVPCTGTLADLHVTVSPSSPDWFQVYWGTALLQTIPRNKNSLLFCVVVALLLNLQFRIGAVAKAFRVSEKPLRAWREALKNGDWSGLGGSHDGLHPQGKLRPDVERYIRVSYRQSRAANGGRMPYGFRKQLAEQVATIWPDQEVCEETLRQLFRNEDAAATAAKEATPDEEARQPVIDAGKPVDLDPSSSPCPSATGDIENVCRPQDIDDYRKPAPDSIGTLTSKDEEERESGGDSCPSIGPEPHFPIPAVEENHRPIPGVNLVEIELVMDDQDTTVRSEIANSGISLLADDDNRKSAPDSIGALNSKDEEERESGGDACPSIGQEPHSPIPAVEENHRPIPDVNQGRNGLAMDDWGTIVHPEIATSGTSSLAAADNRKLAPDSIGDLNSKDKEKRESAGDSSEPVASASKAPNIGVATSTDHPAKPPPNRPCFPLLSGEQPPDPFISQHAGILLLAPEFDQAFGDLPPILRQTGAQILTGCVNQEQGKLIDSTGLGRIVGKVIRDLDRQRTLLDRLAGQGAEPRVYQGNSRLLHLRSADELRLYCDTHHSEYTGCERIILGWSGRQKKVLRGIMMEFFHTAQGEPCMIGHYDNFYDGRQRFFLLRERLVAGLQPWSGTFVWVHDRGYWSYDFLQQIVECGDRFIQWEKDYRQDGWGQAFLRDGRFTISLQGNSSRDQRQQVKVDWREQKWDRLAHGRRFIVRLQHASDQRAEVAIVTNHPTMPAEEVIGLMLRRFLQENDFAYLNRHVGIHELTARKFDRYQAIAHQLQDRQVQSRANKNATQQKLALQEQLKQCLFHLDTLPAVSFATLEKQRTALRQQADRLTSQLRRLAPAELSDNALARISQKVRELKEKFRLNSERLLGAEERQAEEAKRRLLHQQIDQVNAQLAQVARTESRLLMLIEERYVRPNMDRKALVDAVRITARNVFCRALQEFRPHYDNYRDDHVVLRALTHAGGIIVPHPDRIDIYLLPRLDREPEEWDRITAFLQEREERIKQRFGTCVRFLLGRSDEQMFYAVNRAQNRGIAPSE